MPFAQSIVSAYIKDINSLFVFSSSETATKGLHDFFEFLPRFNYTKIENSGYVDTSGRDTVCTNKQSVIVVVESFVMVSAILISAVE